MDGRDELNCPGTIGDFLTRNLSHCEENEHYCWNLVSNIANMRNVSLKFGCIPFSRAGDGIIDCYGATDERMGYCRSRHPWEIDSPSGEFRFLFPNSKNCINPQMICGDRSPIMSQEKNICPWLFEDYGDDDDNNDYRCLPGSFACKKGNCISKQQRCDSKIDCHPDGEDEWFCDMIERRTYRPFTFQNFDYYPNWLAFSSQITLTSTVESQLPFPEDKHYWTINLPWWHCNRGVYVYSKNNPSRVVCLCPPSFYGDRCQFQYQRITLFLRLFTHAIFDRNSLLRLFCYFLGEDQNDNIHVLDFEEIAHNPYNQSVQKYVAYLTRHTTFRSLAVRIDVYQAKKHQVTYQSSWYFNISFPFLPVNRLVQELIIHDDTRTCSSSAASKCIHGICRLYMNIDQSYCQCYDGWIGDKCEIKVDEKCHICASSTQCVTFSRHMKPCVCPVGQIGRTRHVTFNTCQNIQRENNGTLLPIDGRALSCTCICSENHFGDRCQFNKSIIVIQNNKLIHDAAIVHFVEVQQGSVGFLTHIERHLFPNGLLHSTRIVLTNRVFLPSFIFVQTFLDANNFYGNYYLTAFVGDKNIYFLNTSIVSENRCPHVDEFL